MGRTPLGQGPGTRPEPLPGSFGRNAALDGVPVEAHVFLRERQPFAAGHANLLLHEIQARDHLGDRMLHLDAGVHLEEEEILPVLVVDELHGAGILVLDLPGDLVPGLTDAFPQLHRDTCRRGLLHHLLIAPLQRAVALAHVHHVAEAVADDLHFDVPGVGDVALHVQGGIAEGRPGLGRRGAEGGLKLAVLPDDLDALAAAAGRRFQQHRITDLPGDLRRILEVTYVVRAGHQRDSERRDGGPGQQLVAHLADAVGPRAHERDAVLGAGLGQLGFLGQKAVARMEGVATGAQRRGHQGVDLEVALGGTGRADTHGAVREPGRHAVPVGLGNHGHRLDAQGLAGSDDANGYLAPVGDQETANGHGAGSGSQFPSGRTRKRI